MFFAPSFAGLGLFSMSHHTSCVFLARFCSTKRPALTHKYPRFTLAILQAGRISAFPALFVLLAHSLLLAAFGFGSHPTRLSSWRCSFRLDGFKCNTPRSTISAHGLRSKNLACVS